MTSVTVLISILEHVEKVTHILEITVGYHGNGLNTHRAKTKCNENIFFSEAVDMYEHFGIHVCEKLS